MREVKIMQKIKSVFENLEIMAIGSQINTYYLGRISLKGHIFFITIPLNIQMGKELVGI